MVIAQRKARVAQGLSEEFAVEVSFGQTDVCVKNQLERLINGTAERYGRFDILINNAGGGSLPKPLEQSSDKDVRDSLQLNFWSCLWAIQAAFPHMKAQGHGRIVNFGSLNGVCTACLTTWLKRRCVP